MRKIIHVDMDCFFAAVEMRDNPALRDIPIAIGGSRERRGVISTANYPARKFGVRSAMPTGMALKLCPHLTLLPGRYEAYKEASRQIQAIFSRYTSLIEPLSLDEAYLDVTDSIHCHGSATLIAQEIRQTIFNELQLTASAGIAPVKFLAKIASDLNKPNGQYVITPADVPEFLKTLPLGKIPGVGKVSAAKLESMGLRTCEDVQNTTWLRCSNVLVSLAACCGSAARGLTSGTSTTSGCVNPSASSGRWRKIFISGQSAKRLLSGSILNWNGVWQRSSRIC
ncbi:DNA polymerase IV [Citrobacter youngae]|nr:DNA polymerase IV [Citrobacter youngae]